MKRFLLFFLLIVRAMGQAVDPSYELARPIPNFGSTPNTIIKPGGAFGPTAYNDPRPGTYDKFIWGGHRSYGTLGELNNAMWKIEGMTAYVAETGKIYILRPDLITWADLKFDSIGLPDVSLYTTNGILTSDRVLDGNGKSLSFNNLMGMETRANHFIQNSTNNITSIAGTYVMVNAPIINHQATSEYNLITPEVVANQAVVGQVLTLKSVSGKAEFANLPAPPAPPVTIYSGDGTITGNRIVSLGGNNLSVSASGSELLKIEGGTRRIGLVTVGAIDAIGSVVTLKGNAAIKLDSPGDSAVVGSVWTQTAADGSGGFAPLPAPPAAPVTLYSGDGTIPAGTRNVTMAGNLTFSGGAGNNFAVSTGGNVTQLGSQVAITGTSAANGVNITAGTGQVLINNNSVSITSGAAAMVSGMTGVKIRTPAVNLATAKVGQNLQLANTDGTVEFTAAQLPSTHIVVTNVAQLIAAPTGTAGPFLTAETLGYYTAGDGGGGLYSSIALGTTNYGTFKSTTDATKMWKLYPTRQGYWLKQFGAKGDNTTDDTLPFVDWLKSIAGTVGTINIGTFLIRPTTTDPSVNLTIRGDTEFSNMGANPVPSGNCATLKRFGGSAADAAHLLDAGAGAAISVYNVVFDGNKSVEAGATAAYLLYLDASPGDVDGCVFRNAAGSGLNIAGASAAYSQVRNCLFDTLFRGFRMNTAAVVSMNNCRFVKCSEHGLTVAGNDFRGTDLIITDCGGFGIQIAGAHRAHFNNVKIFHTFKSCLNFELTGQPAGFSSKFSDCFFLNANAANNALGVSPEAAATWPTVGVVGTGNEFTVANSFVDCTFGDITGSYQGRSPSHFSWTAPTLAPHYPWEKWQFTSCQFMWTPNWATDFNPAMTNAVSELGSLRSNSEFSSVFGRTGAISSSGFRMDIVESGVAGGQNAVIYANSTSHKLLRDTAGYGTPVAREGPDPLPETRNPPPDDPERPGGPIPPIKP